jgi:plastocyanin
MGRKDHQARVLLPQHVNRLVVSSNCRRSPGSGCNPPGYLTVSTLIRAERIGTPPTEREMSMSHDIHSRIRRAPALIGTFGLIGTLGLIAACGGSPHRAATGIHPGAGQSLAGRPGATGAASSMAGMPGMATTKPAGGVPAAPVGANSVAIKNFAFAPAALTVKAGATVTWINQDTEAHTVTSQARGPLRSSALPAGARYSYRFTTPGTFRYLCTVHPFMTATVTVTQ